MGRWGEEEKKTKGLGGFFLWVGIAALLGYTFYMNMDSISNRMALESAMQEITRRGLGREESELIAKIVEAGEDLGIQMDKSDVHLTMTLVEGNYDLDCRIEYTFTVNLLITKFDISMPIKENLVLVNM